MVRQGSELMNGCARRLQRAEVRPGVVERNVNIAALGRQFADEIRELPFGSTTFHRGDAMKNPHEPLRPMTRQHDTVPSTGRRKLNAESILALPALLGRGGGSVRPFNRVLCRVPALPCP